MKRKIIITAVIFGVSAVIAGAFGAHFLQVRISPKNLEVWHTAVEYQFYHTFALIFLSTLTRLKVNLLSHCYYLFMWGMILFSGSLYVLACTEMIDVSWLHLIGIITPVGGVFFIAGWLTLGAIALKIQ